MTRRSLVLGVLAWVAVVISASAVTWAVIDAAGSQVLSASDVPAQVAAPPEPQVPGSSTGTARPTSPPSSRPTSRPSPTRSRSAKPAPTSRPASPSSAPTTAEPAPAPTPSATPRSPSGPPSPTRQARPPSSQQRTWQGPSGSVTVRCSGSSASLQSASPSDGYRVEVGSRGPGEVEVKFRRDDREVKVRAGCVSGAPRFTTESRGDHSDD